jgi:hypothetical protein
MVEAKKQSAHVTAAEKAPPSGRGVIIGVMFAGAAIIAAYWLIWFGVDRNILASSHDPAYYTFENAFPAADGWLAVALVIAALGLARRRPWGLLFGLLAGGAGIYLGCMDVLFDLENHIYAVPAGGDPSAVLIEAVINVLTFTLGAVLIVYVWRLRDWYLTTR